MDEKTLAMIIKGGGELISYFIGNQPVKLSTTETTVKTAEIETKPPEKPPAKVGVSNEDTIAYQKREISKELLLMEKHLQQRCKINGTACDCCKKHPMAIEALSQEALGMTGDKVFSDLVEWTKEVTPLTTPEASASGKYEEKYPQLAVEARELRKKIMGTTDVIVLFDPDQRKKLSEAINA